MNKFIAVTLFMAGLINFLPVVGVISGDKLRGLYGLTFEDPNLLILMRHRAVLLGLLGAFVMAAAFVPAWRPAAIAVALLSMISFIALAWATGGYNEHIRKVAGIDLAVCLALLVAAAVSLFQFSAGDSANR